MRAGQDEMNSGRMAPREGHAGGLAGGHAGGQAGAHAGGKGGILKTVGRDPSGRLRVVNE